jgi:hypothetical protein
MRTNKYLYVWIVQANYGYGDGWEDVGGGTFKEALSDIKAYRINAPEHRYRMIRRREPNPEWRPAAA